MRALLRFLSASFLVLSVAFGSVAVADGDDKTPEEQAKELYLEGMRLYNLGKYDEAIAKYEEGYQIAPLPGFLYNLAQAYRFKGDCAKAYQLYRNFLRLAEEVEHRDEIEGLVAEMDACRNAPPGDPDPDPDPDPPPDQDPPPDPDPEPEPEPLPITDPGTPGNPRGARIKKIGGIATAALGVVLLGTGTVFALDASSASDDISALFESGGAWTDEYDDIQARGKRSSTLSKVFFAGGAAAVIGGAVLYYLGVRDGHSGHDGPVVSPNPSQPTVGWVWGF